MPTISEIAIVIKAVTAPFTNGLNKARMAARGFAGRMRSFFSPVTNMFGRIGGSIMNTLNPLNLLRTAFFKFGAILAAVAGGGMTIMIKKQFELIDAVAKTSRALKVSIDFLEGLKFAGGQLGVSNEKIIKSVKKFTRTMGEAKLATGAGATVFRIWGKNIEDFQNLNVEDSFFSIAKELKKMKDPTKQAAIAFQFFGRNGIEMLNLINENKGSLQDLFNESAKLKGAFDPIDAARVEAANDAFDKMRVSLGGIFKEIAFGIAPFIKFFSDKFTGAFIDLRQKLEDSRVAIRKGLIAGLTKAAMVVIAFAKVFKIVAIGIEKFFGLDAPGGVQKFENAILKSIATVAFFMDKIGKAKGTIGQDFKDMGSILVLAFTTAFQNIGDNVTALFLSMINGFKFLGKTAIEVFKEIDQAQKLIKQGRIQEVGDLFGDDLSDRINKIADEIRPDQRKVEKGFKLYTDALEKNLNKFADKTKDKFGGALAEGLRQGLMGNKNELNNFIKNFVNEVRQGGGKFESALKDLFKDLGINLGDEIGDNIEDSVAKTRLEPKLALRGSQEAARIAAGRQRNDEAIKDNTKDTAKNTKRMADMLTNLAAGAAGVEDDSIKVFDAAIIAGSVGRIV